MQLLLLDEDSCATNFMSRDSLMSELVHVKSEPITTFLERVRELYEVYGVSSIIVVGGCGAYFSVADTVICMDSYAAVDVTEKAKTIYANYQGGSSSTILPVSSAHGIDATPAVGSSTSVLYSSNGKKDSGVVCSTTADLGELQRRGNFISNMVSNRAVDVRSLSLRQHGKVFVRDKSSIRCGNSSHDDAELVLDLSAVEQLVEVGQLRAIAQVMERLHDSSRARDRLGLARSLRQVIDEVDSEIENKGITHSEPDSYDNHIFHGKLTRPRRFEIAAAINRWRKLKTF
jgi:hypothetical protein